MSTTKDTPSNSDGVRSTASPRVVLRLCGPPADPSSPAHSPSCARTYARLKMVQRTADHRPSARTEALRIASFNSLFDPATSPFDAHAVDDFDCLPENGTVLVIRE